MSFATINAAANDVSFQGRLVGCCAVELLAQGATIIDPTTAMSQLRWPVAATADIEAAYEAALADDNPDPGGDESVITDSMILAAIRANWPTPP